MSQSQESKPRFLENVFFLDVLFDRRTRPVYIYIVIIILIGATLYHWLEGWNWLDSFYFVVITLTTIGYGDFSPTTPLTKIITIYYGVNGVIILLMFYDIIRRLRHLEIPDKDSSLDDTSGQK